MNTLLNYKQWFNSPQAWWHIHTDRTDGKLKVKETVKVAISKGIKFIMFIEHARRYPTYNLLQLYNEIMSNCCPVGIEAAFGLECRLLQGGDIDAPISKWGMFSLVPQPDLFVFLAEHFCPYDDFQKNEYLDDLIKALSNPIVNGWVHPGAIASKKGWSWRYVDIAKVRDVVKEKQIVIENNARYGLPERRLLLALSGAGIPVFTGLDAHAREDLL